MIDKLFEETAQVRDDTHSFDFVDTDSYDFVDTQSFDFVKS